MTREEMNIISQEETIAKKSFTGGSENASKTGSVPAKPVVLVVDDDKKILEAFKYLMESENCEMIAASDVDEVMEKVQNKHLDMIITDFMLETKSSVELFTLIRKSQPEVPVVVMTGYPELISEKDVKMFGGNYLLTKPLELGKLRNVIRTCCNPLKIVSY
ncbi:MAG: response regulator [Ignavibacteriales bacterium]